MHGHGTYHKYTNILGTEKRVLKGNNNNNHDCSYGCYWQQTIDITMLPVTPARTNDFIIHLQSMAISIFSYTCSERGYFIMVTVKRYLQIYFCECITNVRLALLALFVPALDSKSPIFA